MAKQKSRLRRTLEGTALLAAGSVGFLAFSAAVNDGFSSNNSPSSQAGNVTGTPQSTAPEYGGEGGAEQKTPTISGIARTAHTGGMGPTDAFAVAVIPGDPADAGLQANTGLFTLCVGSGAATGEYTVELKEKVTAKPLDSDPAQPFTGEPLVGNPGECDTWELKAPASGIARAQTGGVLPIATVHENGQPLANQEGGARHGEMNISENNRFVVSQGAPDAAKATGTTLPQQVTKALGPPRR